MRYRKSCVTGAGLEASLDASRVVGTGWAASWSPKSTDFVSIESSPISAWAINDGSETAPGTEPSSAPNAVPGPADASGTAAESAGAPGVSALTAASGIASGTVAPGVYPPTWWIIPVNVMAPTMQVACKAFIAPDSTARSPKERYTHVF